jgi:hypothetical protein
MEKKRPGGRFQPLRSIAFKISNDSIMICRNPSATAPRDSAMDRGNLTAANCLDGGIRNVDDISWCFTG